MSLPTREEFIKSGDIHEVDMSKMWNKELYKCPRCNGGVKRDYSMVYMTNPPKYRYFCLNCLYSEVM